MHNVFASNNAHSACAQPGSCIFIYLHADGNPLGLMHEYTVHSSASLGTRYISVSTTRVANVQVTKVHAVNKSNTQIWSYELHKFVINWPCLISQIASTGKFLR